MISKHHPALPSVLLKEIGELLRQGRILRELSLNEAANNLLITGETLALIESGSCAFSGIVAQKIASFYGINEVPIDSLLFDWAMFQVRQRYTCERRNHLSLVGSSPKPWEKMPDCLSEIRRRGHL